jgi:NTP pyrophosphatase (non-canonical NTP hydrolase)
MNDKVNEIYAITQEECAEVVQAISKVMRFGLDTTHNGRTNRDHLEEEIGDLQCMINLLVEAGVCDTVSVLEAARRKRSKLEQWSTIFDGKSD